MKNSSLIIATLLIIFCFVLVFLTFVKVFDLWTSATFFVVIFTIIVMFYQFEKEKISSKEVSLIAILSAFSAISRIPFAAIPSVQPCTYIIICTGYVFGPVAGFMVGATTALVSNIFLGHGPWTIFQIFAWGLVGITASLLNKLNIEQNGIVIFGFVWGYLFGWMMNLWYWLLYIYPHTIYTFGYTAIGSIWFDTLHATGNAIFLLLLGRKTIEIFKRYKDRFHIEFVSKTEPLSS